MFLNMARTATRPSLPASGGVCPWELRPDGNGKWHLVETIHFCAPEVVESGSPR